MRTTRYLALVNLLVGLVVASCRPSLTLTEQGPGEIPTTFNGRADSVTAAATSWREFFQDPYLIELIDQALANNQELKILQQEIEITQNEVKAISGEYRPFVTLGGGIGYEKTPRYTLPGATHHSVEIEHGKEMPEILGDYWFGARASWEVDIWKKLRTEKKAAVKRYLASVEGRNFMITNLIAEIAEAYYHLLALDNQLEIVQQNIGIQEKALKMVRLQKEATKVTELAVKRFEAQLMNTQSLQYEIKQQVVETENRINFLVGRFPQSVNRDRSRFMVASPAKVEIGTPALLLSRRADIRQAELQLEAARLDISVARAAFYPSLGFSASLGSQAINPAYWVKLPLSIFSNLAGDLVGPLVNKRALEANYQTAGAQQRQAVYQYEQTVLSACSEVAGISSKISNLEKIFELKSREVQALTESVAISGRLFASARADYTEVLLTQREALEVRFDLIETRLEQWSSMVDAYRALGGGWN